MEKICVTSETYAAYFQRVEEKIAAEKDYITELDATTGDGDHWANMNTGFSKLSLQAPEWKALPLSELFKKAAMTIMSGVGGSSGILYASAYLTAASTAEGMESLDAAKLLQVLEAQLQGIMQRGNGKPGYKTMIDPLYQAIEQMREALPTGDRAAILAMQKGAKAGMEATRDMEAVRGRACYQANKGKGHLDPGAVTMYYQLDLLAQIALETIV